MSADIRTGIATILWGLAWADHVEECGCQSISGCEITDIMPKIPECAWKAADDLIVLVETKHLRSVDALYKEACEEDEIAGINAPTRRSGEERFGNCIAYEALGHGVSWEDDHATSALSAYVHFDASDLQVFAEEQCGCMDLKVEVGSRDEWTDEEGNSHNEGTYPERQQTVMLDVYALTERHATAWANRRQLADGSSWEVDGTLVYNIVYDRPSLVQDLRAEGYDLDLSEYTGEF